MSDTKVVLVTAMVFVDGKAQDVEFTPLTTHRGVPIYVYGAYFVAVMGQLTFQALVITQIYAAVDEYFRMRLN